MPKVTRKSIGRLARKWAYKVGAMGLAYTATRRPQALKRPLKLGYDLSRQACFKKQKRTKKPWSQTRTKTKKRVRSASDKKPSIKKNFRDKVQKVIGYNDSWGIYSYCSDVQLRQMNRDMWAYYDTDQNFVPLHLFTPRRIWDAASVCFNNKPMAAFGSEVNTLSYRPAMKLKLIDSYFSMFFKSTSNHVVQIELIICSPKKLDAQQSIFESIQFSTDDYKNNDAQTLYTNPTFRLEYATNLHVQYNVEVMRFKLNPGESTYRRIEGPKDMSLDGTKFMREEGTSVNIDSFNTYAKFSKALCFRVINDVTVSTVPGSCGAFPSSSIGGVACRMEHYIKMGDPKVPGSGNLDDGRCSINTGKFYLTSGADQQVVVNNPITVATPQ